MLHPQANQLQSLGIEPRISAWKADILPLNYDCLFSCNFQQNWFTIDATVPSGVLLLHLKQRGSNRKDQCVWPPMIDGVSKSNETKWLALTPASNYHLNKQMSERDRTSHH
jgi:hypothetical protein